MSNASTQPGFLVPVDEPLQDDALVDAIQATVVGVVGAVPADLVRPRWQPNPPNQPALDVDWIALGIVSTTPDTFAAEVHDSGGVAGQVSVQRDELVNVLLSFYGPNAARNDARLRAGLDLAQNREALRAYNLALVEYLPPSNVPALINQTWTGKVDATLVLRRRVSHDYLVRSLDGMPTSQLDNEAYVTPLKLNPAEGA